MQQEVREGKGKVPDAVSDGRGDKKQIHRGLQQDDGRQGAGARGRGRDNRPPYRHFRNRFPDNRKRKRDGGRVRARQEPHQGQRSQRAGPKGLFQEIQRARNQIPKSQGKTRRAC